MGRVSAAPGPARERWWTVPRIWKRRIMKRKAAGSVWRSRWTKWAVVILAILVLVLVWVEGSSIHYGGRTAQNAADAATLAGMWRLGKILDGTGSSEDDIVEDMLDFATRNGVAEGDTVVGYYLDAEGARLGLVGSGIPPDAGGIEAVVRVRAPSPLTRFLGLKGWPITRQADCCLGPPAPLPPLPPLPVLAERHAASTLYEVDPATGRWRRL